MAKERPQSSVVSSMLTVLLIGVLAFVLIQVLSTVSKHPQSAFSYQQKVRMMLELHEGRRASVYSDTVGVPTIGVGHNLAQSASAEEIELLRSRIVSDKQIDLWLTQDIATAEQELERVFGNEAWFQQLSENRRVVLVDMCFNLGLTRLRSFKRMFAALEAGNFDRAADEMLDSRWARQVGQRAQRLSEMMRSDSFLHPEVG